MFLNPIIVGNHWYRLKLRENNNQCYAQKSAYQTGKRY